MKVDETLYKFNENLIQEIEEMVYMYDIDYLDAVINFCEKYNMDVEVIGEIIANNAFLKSKIEIEAENLNFVKKVNRLPL